MNDEMLDRLESLPGPLVPYQCGVPCWHQMQVDAMPACDTSLQPSPAGDGVREMLAITA